MECVVEHKPDPQSTDIEYDVLLRRVLAPRFIEFEYYNRRGSLRIWALGNDIKHIMDKTDTVVAVHHQGRLRALALVTLADRSAVVNYLRSCQRGCGRFLMDAVFDLARKHNKQHVELEALDGHFLDAKRKLSLVGYYTGMGFYPVDAISVPMDNDADTRVVPMRADV